MTVAHELALIETAAYIEAVHIHAAMRSIRADLDVGFLQVADDQLQEIDLMIELLGGLAEPGSAQARQLRPQLLDMQGLGVEFRLQKRREGAKLVGIGRQVWVARDMPTYNKAGRRER